MLTFSSRVCFFIERNLYPQNNLPYLPMRCCLIITGNPSSIIMTIEINAQSKLDMINPNPDNIISNGLFNNGLLYSHKFTTTEASTLRELQVLRKTSE